MLSRRRPPPSATKESELRHTGSIDERTNDNSRRYLYHYPNHRVREVIYRKQKKNESLEQFHADLAELSSRADREDELVRDMLTANMNNEKIAEELVAET